MTRHYRVIKDHPLWEIGAILSNEDTRGEYKAVSDIWDQELPGYTGNGGWYESQSLVEHQPEWFERVYSVKVLGQAKYLTREAAKKFHNDSFTGKDK